MTPIHRVLKLSSHISELDAFQVLTDHDFDAVPVIDEFGTVLGIYSRKRMPTQRPIRDSMQRLSQHNLVASTATFPQLLESLSGSLLVVVIDGNQIAGIVTPSDIWTNPGRVYLYSILATLEHALAEYLRIARVAPDEIDSTLSEKRLSERLKIKADLTSKNLFRDDISTLSLVDLIHVCRMEEKFAAAARQTGRSVRGLSRGLADLRNDVMHASRPLRGVDSDGLVGTMRKRVEQIFTLIDICSRASDAVEANRRPIPAN